MAFKGYSIPFFQYSNIPMRYGMELSFSKGGI